MPPNKSIEHIPKRRTTTRRAGEKKVETGEKSNRWAVLKPKAGDYKISLKGVNAVPEDTVRMAGVPTAKRRGAGRLRPGF